MSTRKVRAMTADDEPHIRALLKAVLGQLGAEVVAEAADGAEAIRLFGEFKPDITLLDINMPKLTGDAALEQILRLKPDALVIMLSSQDSIDTVRRCIDLGARNYILKNNSAEEIIKFLKETWKDYVEELSEAGASQAPVNA